MHVHVFMMHPFAAKAIQGSDLKKSSILPVDGLFLPVLIKHMGMHADMSSSNYIGFKHFAIKTLLDISLRCMQHVQQTLVCLCTVLLQYWYMYSVVLLTLIRFASVQRTCWTRVSVQCVWQLSDVIEHLDQCCAISRCSKSSISLFVSHYNVVDNKWITASPSNRMCMGLESQVLLYGSSQLPPKPVPSHWFWDYPKQQTNPLPKYGKFGKFPITSQTFPIIERLGLSQITAQPSP
eukprot:jgi/Botrbrau1/14528/Bobra.0223s0017.1